MTDPLFFILLHRNEEKNHIHCSISPFCGIHSCCPVPYAAKLVRQDTGSTQIFPWHPNGQDSPFPYVFCISRNRLAPAKLQQEHKNRSETPLRMPDHLRPCLCSIHRNSPRTLHHLQGIRSS